MLESTERKGPNLEDYPLLQELNNVFIDEIPSLPPKRGIDFSIDLMHGYAPVFKHPYKKCSSKLMELKM